LRLALVSFKAMQTFMNRGDFAYWVEVRVDDLFRAKEIGVELKDYIEPYPLDKFLSVVWQFKHDVDRIAKGEIRQAKLEAPKTPVDIVSQMQSIARVTGYRADFELERKEKYQVLDWQTRNKNLFTSLAIQRVIFALFFLIIIFVAAFNVVGSQTMIIKDKTKEIAILKSMGATKTSIRMIFVIQGMIIGVIGTAIGLIVGFGVSYLVRSLKYPLDPMVYFISYLPIDVNPLEFLAVGAASLVCILVATYYASGKAAEKTPVDGLRQV
ncbi:MAG: ABC transporter permease, partial [Myxococcales bacterium]|nr:ABC transporter permease [Myxococcales bacterium]